MPDAVLPRTSRVPAKTDTAGAGLRRGLGAGLAGGVASGLFLLVVGEPSIDEAVRLENAAAAGHAAGELFTREQQHLGLIVASGLYGAALGGVMGVVLYAMSRRRRADPWARALKIAAAGFVSYFLVPFLKYPASPPGVGDPETFGLRTGAYLFLVSVSVGAWWLGVATAKHLKARGVARHHRHLMVAGCYLLLLGTAFIALPAPVDPSGVPAGLLWEFRMASLGGQAVLWIGTGGILGLLTLRAQRRLSEAGGSLPATE